MLEKLKGDPTVRNRGCDIVVKAEAGTPVRIVSHLLRWHYGDADAQKAMQSWLASRGSSPSLTPPPEIRALVFCDDLKKVKTERAVREFLQAGADVRVSPVETPFRRINAGSRLLIAANPGANDRPVTDAIYYEAERDDDLIGMLREMFDHTFRDARRLVWDSRRARVRRAEILAPFIRELRALFSPAHVVYRLAWVLLGAALMFAVEFVVRALAG